MSVGDQILSVDETVVENTAFSPDDVTSLLDANSGRGYTQIQILPGYAMQRRRGKILKLYINRSNSKINIKKEFRPTLYDLLFKFFRCGKCLRIYKRKTKQKLVKKKKYF